MSRDGARSRGRLAQKLRTRAALLEAARELVARGQTPTVAAVADAATVSRATAYRYFPTQEALLVEVPLDQDAPTAAALFGPDAPGDPEERAVLVQRALYDLCRDHEAEFRVFLRGSITRSLTDRAGPPDPLRGARRAALLDEALAPLRGELPPAEIERLACAIAVMVGIEAMVVLRDVLHLSHHEARAAGEWGVRRLVRAARARPGGE